MVSNNVSSYQYNPSYQRDVSQTQRVQPQQRTEESADARRADAIESRPQASSISYNLGTRIDTYA